jgi:hypothetical protein
MNHTLEFTHRMSNSFLVINIKIKLDESMFETGLFGVYGSTDFPSNDRISKWITMIENDIHYYDMFSYNDENTKIDIGLKNNYFHINGLNIPIKLIKNDLIMFLKKFIEINKKENYNTMCEYVSVKL